MHANLTPYLAAPTVVLFWHENQVGKVADKEATSPVSRRCEPFLTISKKKNVLQEPDFKSEGKAAPQKELKSY